MMQNKGYGSNSEVPVKIDPRYINAEEFASYDDLQDSMAAADEAMLELGPAYGLLSTSGATRKETQQFLSIYGEALLRRGKLRQLCIQAEEGEHAHLIPQPKTETPHTERPVAAVELPDRTAKLRNLYRKVGRLLAGSAE